MCHSFSLQGGSAVGATPQTESSCFITLSGFYLDTINVLQNKSRATVWFWVFFFPLMKSETKSVFFFSSAVRKKLLYVSCSGSCMMWFTVTHTMSRGSSPQPNRSSIKWFSSSTEADGRTRRLFAERFMFDLHLQCCSILCIPFRSCFVTFKQAENCWTPVVNCDLVFLLCKFIAWITPEN